MRTATTVFFASITLLLTTSCRPHRAAPTAVRRQPSAERREYPSFGAIERLDPALDDLIAPDTKIEKLAEGLDWAEGPLWSRKGGYLLFSDVPQKEPAQAQRPMTLERFLLEQRATIPEV